MKTFWRIFASWMAIFAAAFLGKAIAKNFVLDALVWYTLTLYWYLQVYLNRTKKGEI